jgi:hypothetical protein
MKQAGVLFSVGCALIAATGLCADTWWQAQLDQGEAFNKQSVRSHEAMCAANPGWKTFKTFSQPLACEVESVPVRVKMTGIRNVWLGSVGRGQSFCGEPVWVDAKGNKTPVLIATNAPLAGKPAGFTMRAVAKKPHALRSGSAKTYAYGFLFNECQALAEAPEGTEWFEAVAGQNNPNNKRSNVQLIVELESRLANAESRTDTAKEIQNDVARQFNTPQDIFEQLLEQRENLWGGSAVSADLRQLMDRYTGACPPGLREKAQKLRPYTPENLAKVRALYYLEQARQRLDLCRKTADLVTREGGDVPWAEGEIAALEKSVTGAFAAEPSGDAGLFGEVFRLRRKILFAHPALKFETLLINKNAPTMYSHNCDQYLGRHSRVGEGPTLLTAWQSDHPQARVLLKDRLPPGAFYRPSLHPDATKFVFAYADHTTNNPFFFRYFLYEAAIDGSWVRQLTGTPRDPLKTMDGRETVMIEDSDPSYLPDGGIVFVSTRSQNYGRCHGGRYTPALMLYRSDKDGSALRPLSYGIENETTPSVLNDGRIIYTRWEYVDRHEMEFHKLWWKRPDGTGVSSYYGNDTIYPLMISEARAIPGSQKVIATGVAHHSFHTGTMIMIDVQKGENGPDPVTRITPEVRFPESDENDGKPGAFSTPFPLTENLYLASYAPNRIPFQGTVPDATGYVIVIVDTAGGREPIFRDAGACSFSPQPVVPCPMPPALPSMLPEKPESDTGIYAVQNVNLTRNDPKGLLKSGQIKYLRFNQIYVKPIASNAALNCRVGVGLAKKILGLVPVADDGSVVVRVPAGVPLQIQALDENGMAVMTERSFHYLHAGERRGCVGCHAESLASPPDTASLLMRKPAELTPPAGPAYEGGFSFVRTVQPVLDRYCVRCHGLSEGQPPKGVNLVGNQSGSFSQSYVMLARYTNPIGLKPETHGLDKNVSRPMDYYAHGSRLGKMLLANHQKVNLPREDFQRIIDWLDLNSQANGDSSHNRIEHARVNGEKEKALREAVKSRFGEALARQPYHALVNHANPEESRLLLAPLSKAAGGWGQLANGWTSKADADYKKAHDLIVATIDPLPPDISGTCGRDAACACNDCWVRLSRLNVPPLAPTPIR